MKRVISLVLGEKVMVTGASLLLLWFSYMPLVWQYKTTPRGQVFLGNWGFPPDFFGNLVIFQEGRLGHWLAEPRLSSTIPGEPGLVKMAYIFLGQLSRLVPLPGIVFFHASRLGLSAVFVYLTWVFVRKTFREKWWRVMAFVLALFSTAWPGGEELLWSWTPLAVFQRSAYYPHYLFGFVFLLGGLLFLEKALEGKGGKNWWIASLLGLSAGLSHPPVIIICYVVLPIFWLLGWVEKVRGMRMKAAELWREARILMGFGLIASLPLFYLAKIGGEYPWNLIATYDLMYDFRESVSLKQFWLGIGPTAFLSLAGAVLAIKKGGVGNRLMAPWAVAYAIGFWFLGRVMGYNSVRFLQTPFFVFLGILSAMSLAEVAKKLAQGGRITQIVIGLVLAVGVILPSGRAFKESQRINEVNFRDEYWYTYTTEEKMAAMSWLWENSQAEEIILSSGINGMLIAFLTANIPYYTIYAEQLEQEYARLAANAAEFWGQKWSEKEAKEFLRANRIELVFWGREEGRLSSQLRLNYLFLESLFENEEVIIYRVKDGWE